MGNLLEESAASPDDGGKRGGIQSIEVGAPLLRALVDGGDAMTLTALATRAHMPLSKTHKYLASFVRVGLMTQGANALYKLGPFARELGLAALTEELGLSRAIRARRLLQHVESHRSLLQ
jgi:DNA-binding IclR family transcriptional regulator